MWVCGLKRIYQRPDGSYRVSHPMWVCGLKLAGLNSLDYKDIVTPYVGVWIETKRNGSRKHKYPVTPYVGVWIETF